MQQSKYNLVKKILPFFFLFCANYVFAQDTTTVSCSEIKKVFTIVEMMPEFPGGNAMFNKFIKENLRYTTEDSLPGKGKVYVTFIVTKDGTLCNPKIIRGIRQDLDDEALRVVKLMPKWTPGKQNGVPVNVQYNLPVKFTLK